MIEIVSRERCIACDRCVEVCPRNVFDRGADGVPVIARQADCQTCFMCEAYCPADALFVAPLAHPARPDSPLRDEARLAAAGLLGSYRREIGWGGAAPRARGSRSGPSSRPRRRRSSPRSPCGPGSARESETRSAKR